LACGGVGNSGSVLVAGVAASSFAALARRAASGVVSQREADVFRAFNQLPDGWHRPVWMLMQAGALPSVAVGAGALSRRDRRRAIVLLVTGTAVWAAVKPLKRAVGRGRPADFLDDVRVRGEKASDFGFPSGHAAVSMTCAVIAAPVLSEGGRRAVFGWAVGVGMARQYVGAHLPLDVFGGSVLGVASGSAVNALLRKIS
jgi:glycosyltransferase 2 family protein